MVKRKGSSRILTLKGTDLDKNLERLSQPNNPIIWGRETPPAAGPIPEANQGDSEQQELEAVIEPPMTRRVTRGQSRLSTTSTQDVRDSIEEVPNSSQDRTYTQ
jgi:hypothetical protein